MWRARASPRCPHRAWVRRRRRFPRSVRGVGREGPCGRFPPQRSRRRRVRCRPIRPSRWRCRPRVKR
ncbi:hypothetical protein FNH06_21180 [Amycolatopsis acidiphila]|uniref:Uncharacterized protein n=1 Tax=Amycolatopsis acidiphila TaxID=715473 RepID=A0A558A7S5_9PSEU|nr:hypothetical protein FNH06_21180 [Amycolatopsis acidiphila]